MHVVVIIIYNDIYENLALDLMSQKVLVCFFIMLLKGLINVIKSTIYHYKFKVVTFKLNITNYIPLKYIML